MKVKILIAACILAVLFAGYKVWNSELFAGSEEIKPSQRALNVETGYRFLLEIGPDFPGWPVKCPDTREMTGWPAEVCYWNQCANEVVQGFRGTWVVLNETLGKDESSTCPVCGRRVVGRNPKPPGFRLKGG